MKQREEQEKLAKIEREKLKNDEELLNQRSQKGDDISSLMNDENNFSKKEENKQGKDIEMKDDFQNLKNNLQEINENGFSKFKNEFEFVHPDQVTPKKDRNITSDNVIIEGKKGENSDQKNS